MSRGVSLRAKIPQRSGRYVGMTETERHPVGPDQAPDEVDTSPTPEDGPQDVTDDCEYEEVETDESDDIDESVVDPRVREVTS